MNSGPLHASRILKMAALGLCLSLSFTAGMAEAQQRPQGVRGIASDVAAVSERTATPKRVYTEGASVIAARIAGSHEVTPTSERFSGGPTLEHHRVPMVSDWSTRQVVFGKPRTKK